MAGCGTNETFVVTEPDEVWMWGKGLLLRFNTLQENLLPVRGHAVFGARMIMVATTSDHSADVMSHGSLLILGLGMNDQLVLGDLRPRLRTERINKELFGRWPALMIAWACVLTAGGLWTFGVGKDGLRRHGDKAYKLVMTQVVAEHWESAQIVMVVTGGLYNVAGRTGGGVWT